MGASSELPG